MLLTIHFAYEFPNFDFNCGSDFVDFGSNSLLGNGSDLIDGNLPCPAIAG